MRTNQKIKICFLASNDLTHDPRVRRQIESAAKKGFKTLALGFSWARVDGVKQKETAGGYGVERFYFKEETGSKREKAKNIAQVPTTADLIELVKPIIMLPVFLVEFLIRIVLFILRVPYYLYRMPFYFYRQLKVNFFPDFHLKQIYKSWQKNKKIKNEELRPVANLEKAEAKNIESTSEIKSEQNVQTKSLFWFSGFKKYVSNFYYQINLIEYYKSLTSQFISRSVIFQPDIVHANDLDTLLAGYLIKRKTGAKLVYDAHEIWTEMGSTFPRTINFVFKMIEKYLLKRVDAFVSVNQSIIDYLARLYKIDFKQESIITSPIYNAPNYQKVRKNYSVKSIKVLYQGRFEFNRGLEEYIEATDKVKSAEFFIRGYGINEPELRELAQKKKNQNLTFLEPVEMSEMTEKASFAQIGVLPYLPKSTNNYLCTPNKLFEYMMAGLALCVSDLPELKYLVQKHQIGVTFTPGDSDSLAKAIANLAKNKEKLIAMQKNSLKASQVLNWEKESEKLSLIYQQILKQ
jgi:glycosyltransferase involved in cell wall biosynthesis